MKNLILLLSFIGLSMGTVAQNDTTRYTMVNGYGFTYNRLKAKAALVMPSDTVQNKLQGSIVVLNDTLYVRRATRWEAVSGGGAGIPSGGTTGQILAKDSDTSFDVSWIDNYTDDVRETVKASTSITKGQAVYVSGADGTNVIVSKASNASEPTSSKTLGLLFQNLATNGTGFVIIQGRLSGLNTSGATAGDPVWLGTNGNLLYGVANKPVAPAHMVYLGVVTRVNSNNGEIFVHVQNGFEIEELHDVLITDSINNQLLAYDSTTRLWKNRTIAQVLGYTPVKTTDTASMLAPYLRKADTATLSARIDQRVKYSDTASMLTPYLRKADTLSLSNRINLKLNISDTSSMLSPYYRTATANAALATKLNISDTASMLVPYLRDADTATLSARIDQRVKYTDTSAMLTPYLRKVDTTAMLSPYARTATVNAQLATKVNISDTLAMLSPYLRKVDTTAMLSPYARTATVNAQLAGKVNISDTASMLSPYARTAIVNAALATKLNITDTTSMLTPYLRKADTTAMLSPYARTATVNAALATKVNISDTLAMLNPYLRKVDTATLSNRINLKVNISDTSTMLTPYVRAAGYGLTKSGQTLTVDTLNIATRAWRQKGLDSLAALEVSGSGTTNYVSKFTATGTIGNSQIFDNGTSVGINTTTPNSGQRLQVNGQTRIDVDSGQAMLTGVVPSFGQVFTQTIDNNGDTRISTNRHLIFRTSDVSERMRIFSNGRVGINTGATDAGYQLDVIGTARINSDIRINTTTGFNSLITNPLGGGGLAFVSQSDPTASGNRLFSVGFGSINYPAQARIEALSTEAWSATNRGTALRFNTTANGATGSSVRMYIENDGFVGVNTSAPLARLHVAGNMRSDNDAYFATSSGRVGIGTATPGYEVDALVNTNGFDGYNVYGQQGGINEVIGYRSSQGNGIGLIMGTTGAGASSAMGGANQSVIYGVGSQNLIFGTNSTERMRIFNNGRVFIGTSPGDAGYQLDVNGGFRAKGSNFVGTFEGTDPAVSWKNSAYEYYAQLLDGINRFRIVDRTANVERITLLSNGNVGIATTNPLTRLHVNSGDGYIASFNTTVTTADTSFLGLGNFSSYQPGAGGVSIASYHNLGATFATDMGLYTHSGSSMGERVRITSGGNVGIGTTSPNAPLHVAKTETLNAFTDYIQLSDNTNGLRFSNYFSAAGIRWDLRRGTTSMMSFTPDNNVGIGIQNMLWAQTNRRVLEINGTSDALIGLNVNGAKAGYLWQNGNDLTIAAENAGFLQFGTNGTAARMRITSAGNVGINTTNPETRFVIADGTNYRLAMRQWSGTGMEINAWNDAYQPTIPLRLTANYLSFNTGSTSTERMRIFENGRVFIGASPTDAGNQLDINGDTRVTGVHRVTGRIEVNANDYYGLSIGRTGTNVIASQIYNSNGILYYGVENSTGGGMFTGSTPYAAVIGSGVNRPFQLATNNTVRMEIDSVGLVGINTTAPTERLDVNGRVRIRTVDSTATATNMLYVDNNGVVKKTAVPGSNVSYVTSTNTVASGWTFAKDSARNLNHNFINVVLDNTTNEGTATLQMAIYQATSSFTTGQWVNVASLSSAYTPKTTIVFELPGYVSGTTYYTSGNVQFSGASEYTGTKVVRIDPSGNVDVRIGTVSASATASGTNYVLIPIVVTYALYNVPL